MIITTRLPAALRATIDSLPRAMAFIEALDANGLLFHFEDDVRDCLWGVELTDEDLDILSSQRDALYADDFEWGEFECPIGYALHVSGHEMN